MPDALRRVPGPFKVDILQTEIGRDQGFMTTRNGKHRTVVPNPQTGPWPFCGSGSNAANQRFLRQRHGAINIQGRQCGRERPRQNAARGHMECRQGSQYTLPSLLKSPPSNTSLRAVAAHPALVSSRTLTRGNLLCYRCQAVRRRIAELSAASSRDCGHNAFGVSSSGRIRERKQPWFQNRRSWPGYRMALGLS